MAVSAVTLTALVIWLWPRPQARRPERQAAPVGAAQARSKPKKVPRRQREAAAEPGRTQFVPRNPAGPLVTCQFYTAEPGFLVLIDGVPARDGAGALLATPCEIDVPVGQHAITFAKEEYAEHTEQTFVSQTRAFEAAPPYDPFAEPRGYFASRFAQAPLGQPLELESLDPGGPAWDPYLSDDGLALWFAADGREGKGIYVARRQGVLDEFAPAQNVARMADLPASPVPTADELLVACMARGKSQIRAFVRDDQADPFRQGPLLKSSEAAGQNWPTGWIAGDGRLLVWREQRGQTAQFLWADCATRQKKFSAPAPLEMPGDHPRLSSDGLRQCFLQDGTIMLAERATRSSPFSSPREIGRFDLGAPSGDQGRRFWPSADYQWLYFGTPPTEGGQLYAVRINKTPRHGYAPTGKSIAPRAVAANSANDDQPADLPSATGTTDAADPRAGRLPYVLFRQRLEQALAAFEFAQAGELIEQARTNPDLAAHAQLIQWDAHEAALVHAFWNRLLQTLGGLPRGTLLRAGALRIEFERFEDGMLIGKSAGSGSEFAKRLAELPPADMASMVDLRAREDQAAQLEAAAFLASRAKPNAALVKARLARAGEPGQQFAARQLDRTLNVIEQEIARENIGAALEQIDRLVSGEPKSNAAARALALRDSLYTRTVWRAVGIQQWDRPEPGEYAATRQRAAGSYLTAPATYANFLLTLEWKTTSDTAQGGVYFRYDGKGDFRKGASKLHLANDFAIRDNPDQFSTGALFGKRAPRVNPVKPSGEWNTLELRVEGDRARATINGTLALDAPLADPNMARQGYVCLDGDYGGMSYRKILLYELPRRASQ